MKIAVLMGGVSPERDVSLNSGQAVFAALQRLGMDCIAIDPAEDGQWLKTLIDQSIQQVFNIMHGGAGENGEVRGALNSVGIACTGSDVLGCVLAMHKPSAKSIWHDAGIPTPRWRLAQSADEAEQILADLPLPLFVKPAAGGSSTNSGVVREAAQLPAAIAAALEESAALVEALIEGDEYTLSVLDDQPLPLIHIVADGSFYDYNAKYHSRETRFICPCQLPEEQQQRLTTQALAAFHRLHCQQWGRVDFVLDRSGQPYFLEVNTVPGMTSHSLVPMAALAVGLSFDHLVERIMHGAARKQ